MFGKIYDPGIQPSELMAGQRRNSAPTTSRKELISRNSFPSVNDNRHLTRLIEKIKGK